MFDINVDEIPLPALEAEICAWAGRLAAGTCAWLLGVAAFDRRQGWSGVGIRSCAHWLSWKCGTSLRTAAEQVRVARALETLPALRTAFAAGRLSYSKVRAVSRVAGPDDESEWVRQALHSTAGQLDRLVTAWRGLHPGPDNSVAGRHDGRECRWRWDDGDLVLHARLPPDQGALLVAAVEAARATLTTTEPPPTTTPTGNDRPGDDAPADAPEDPTGPDNGLGRADLADPNEATDPATDPATLTTTEPIGIHPTASQDGAPDRTDGATAPDCDSGPAAALTAALRPASHDRRAAADGLVALAEAFLSGGAPTLLDPARHAVTVHLDARLLDPANDPDSPTPARHGTAGPPTGTEPAEPAPGDPTADSATAPGPEIPGTVAQPAGRGIRLPCCHLAPQIGIHPETARRLACDSVITTLLTSPDGDPLAVGRAHRTPPARQRKALYARDRHCTYPGCEHTRWLQAHHIEHWGRGGLTDLDNLTLVCGHHHRAVHEGGATLRRQADGTVVAVLRDGTVVHPAPPLTAGHDPFDRLRHHTPHVGPTTVVPRWWGDHLHLADSISAIVQASAAVQASAVQASRATTPTAA